MKFSLIICGYNEEKHLDDCIQSCLDQNYPKNEYEIIYVDNNSKDKSFSMAKKYPIICLEEKKQGLSEARNCGILEANGDIFIFLDADLKLDNNYLRYHEETFNDPRIGAGGGMVLPLVKTWVSDYLGVSLFECYPRFIKNKYVRTYPGCNLTIKRSVLDEIGFFKEGLKTSEGVTRFAEDKEICERVRSANYKILYNSKAIVFHKNTFELKQLVKIWFKGANGRVGLIRARKKDFFSQLFRFNLPLISILLFALSFFINIKILLIIFAFAFMAFFSLSFKSSIETRLFFKSFFIKPWMDMLSLIIINLGVLYYRLIK